MHHAIAGSNKGPSNHGGVYHSFVSAWEQNNGTGNFSPKYGATTTGGLSTRRSGPLPNGYSPVKPQASMLLGTDGDNGDYGTGDSSWSRSWRDTPPTPPGTRCR